MPNPMEIPKVPGAKKENNLERDIVKLTREEYELLRFTETGNQKAVDLMKAKGIEFNDGDILVEVDGKKFLMNTGEDDFGTMLLTETVERLYGREALDLLK